MTTVSISNHPSCASFGYAIHDYTFLFFIIFAVFDQFVILLNGYVFYNVFEQLFKESHGTIVRHLMVGK
jgi:hypothetical protein